MVREEIENIESIEHLETISNLLNDAKRLHIKIDTDTARTALQSKLEQMIEQLSEDPEGKSPCALSILELNKEYEYDFNLWFSQNLFHNFLKSDSGEQNKKLIDIIRLGKELNISMKHY